MNHKATRTSRSAVTSGKGRSTTAKVLATIVLVTGAAGVAGLGTFGGFTSSTAAEQSVATGKVNLSQASQAARGFDVAATGMVPGDYAQRAVQLTRGSDSETFGSVKLTTTAATPGNALITDANGLKLKVDLCPTAWTKAANSNDLTCASGQTTVLAQRAVVGGNLDLGGALANLNSSGRAANLRFEVSLPQDAGNNLQGLSNSITFTFDATQRAGEAR